MERCAPKRRLPITPEHQTCGEGSARWEKALFAPPLFPRSESPTQQNIVRMGIELVFRKMAVCALLFAPLVVSAQSEDLEKDLPFFKQQEGTYQRWLDQAGLGQVLRVHGTQIEQNRLSLYLGFRY